MKENMLPYFVTSEDIKLYVKDPFPKFEERPPEKWFNLLVIVGLK
jgi:hypothetical protein